MSVDQLSDSLKQYVPEKAAPICAEWMIRYNAHLRVNRERHSKFGDYMQPVNGNMHRITINHNLNKYSFLITFLHEFAHLHTYNIHKNKVAPHGSEWKIYFRQVVTPFLVLHIFPDDVQNALANYMKNPAASSCVDDHLYRVLKKYDANKTFSFLEELSAGTRFKLKGHSNIFIKGKQLRKNFVCTDEQNKRIVFRVSPIAEVTEIKD